MGWLSIIYLIAAGLLVWWAVRFIKRNPKAFSKANCIKSIGTLGWLTLMMIAVIAVCVLFLKS